LNAHFSSDPPVGPAPTSAAAREAERRTGVLDATRTHYAQLDGLRGLAILLVMFYHFCLPHPAFHGKGAPWVLQVAQSGWMGVDLFFVLSGFLITGILVETRTHQHYFRNFLARRFLRIWPLYYLSLVVLLVLPSFMLTSVPPQVSGMQEKQAWFWLYAANWLFALEGGFTQTSGGYFWSLAVEEQFYLIWPFVVYVLSDRQLLRVSIALLAMSLLLRVALSSFGVSPSALYAMTFTHLDGLAMGACLAICVREPHLMARVQRVLPWAAAAAVAGLIATRVLDGDFFFWSRQMATFGYTCCAILFGALLVWSLGAQAERPLGRILSTGWMRQMGKYSYALYLVHVPIAGALFPPVTRALEPLQSALGYDAAFACFVLIAFAASWIAACLSWYLFEKRILALKRYFTYEPTGGARAIGQDAGSASHMHRG
jgi:peptidoglycan/LPS O-acetylase OafA/YrhL